MIGFRTRLIATTATIIMGAYMAYCGASGLTANQTELTKLPREVPEYNQLENQKADYNLQITGLKQNVASLDKKIALIDKKESTIVSEHQSSKLRKKEIRNGIMGIVGGEMVLLGVIYFLLDGVPEIIDFVLYDVLNL